MSQKINPSEMEPAPFEYFSSALSNAYFSGVGLDVLFDCVCVTHDESKNAFNPQIRVEIKQAKAFDKTVDAAIQAKDWLEKIVAAH